MAQVEERGPLDPPCKIGDLDGDGLSEVVLMDEGKGAILVLDGASGEQRASAAVPKGLSSEAHRLCLADFAGGGKRTVVASLPGDYTFRPGQWKPTPPELAFFTVSDNALKRQSEAKLVARTLTSADVDGDGKQELIAVYDPTAVPGGGGTLVAKVQPRKQKQVLAKAAQQPIEVLALDWHSHPLIE